MGLEKSLLSGIALGLISHLCTSAWAVDKYVGINSTEAIMDFTTHVEFATRQTVDTAFVRAKIDSQLTHLFGPMGVAKYLSVPKGDEKITHIKVSKRPAPSITYDVTYSYHGTIVLQSGPRTKYEVALPINPDRIYRAALVTRGNGSLFNPCTDPHYQSEGDFWYFWNPEQEGCPLREGIDYNKVPVQIQRLQNSVRTYPEYARLADASGTIRVSILMGMDDPSTGKDPNRSRDSNASNFVGIRNKLISMGYASRVLTKPELQVLSGNATLLPYVERLVKLTPRANIEVTLFFGPSGIDEDSTAFHYFYRDALANASIMMYDGHSGLGSHLDLRALEEIEGFRLRPNRNQYQIYYFNSCSSYTYYNTLYFGRKVTGSDPAGTKNLDIITNGLATYFSTLGESDMTLMQAVDAWAEGTAFASYQQIAKLTDSGNLFGVNGDEDNPTSPSR